MTCGSHWLVSVIAISLVACSDAGSNATLRRNMSKAPSVIGAQGQDHLQLMVECASLMKASEELVDQIARTKRSSEQSQLTMEMTFRGGRARLLRLDSVGLATQQGGDSTRIDNLILSRAAAIVRARASQPIEQYTDRIRGEADRCYGRLY